MLNEKIETEKKWLTEIAIPELLKTVVDDNSNVTTSGQGKEFKLNDIKIDFIGYKEAFMLTICYRAAISYQLNGNHKNSYLVVKKTPQLPPELFDGINFGALFFNEILGYREIIPAFEKFANIKLNVSRYFYGDVGRCHAEIVMEDFSTNGFRVTKERYNLSLEHAMLAVRYLAKFHSIGFAMRHSDPQQYKDLTEKIQESRYTSNPPAPAWELAVKTSVVRLKEATRKYQPEINAEFVDKLWELVSGGFDYGKRMMEPKEPYITLCHGDYLRNNIAFKYAKGAGDNEVPIDVIMFDLQTLRSSSPMIDLSVLLALSTFRHVRCENFEEIFTAYVDELRNGYEKFSGDKVPDFLNYNALLKEYIRLLPYSISIAASFLFSLVEPTEMSSEEMFAMQFSEEQIIEDTMTRGGAIVDEELAHQVKELYELSQEHGVTL